MKKAIFILLAILIPAFSFAAERGLDQKIDDVLNPQKSGRGSREPSGPEWGGALGSSLDS